MHSNFIQTLSLTDCPRQTVPARDVFAPSGTPTDRLMLLNEGRVRGADGITYFPGHVMNFKEFLAADFYETELRSITTSRIVHIPRSLIRDCLSAENPLTWALARCVAAEHVAFRKPMQVNRS